MAAIDLAPYGIFHTFDPAKGGRLIPEDVSVSRAWLEHDELTIFDISGAVVLDVALDVLIGSGSFGKTYSIRDKINGFNAVVKVLPRAEFSTHSVAMEFLTQLIVVKETEDYDSGGLVGPFCPRVFNFARDGNSLYIVMERMDTDIKRLIKHNNKAKHLIAIFQLIATVLDILWTKLQFNHRDLKPDNIMINGDGQLRLIDFGTACLSYGGRDIEPGYSHIRNLLENCKSTTRDLKTLFYYVLRHTKYKETGFPFKRVLKALMFSGEVEPAEWNNTYASFNSESVLPNLEPRNLIRVLELLKFKGLADNAEIEPDWVKGLVELNKGLVQHLSVEEFNTLDKGLVLEYLKQHKSARLLRRVSMVTNNATIKTFCEMGLEDQDLELNTAGRHGGSKTRRLRKGRKGLRRLRATLYK
jgi:serine/threonine protein kinase